jgi:peptidoglycan hydrolase-like protein with peptidoglycan-binding domain
VNLPRRTILASALAAIPAAAVAVTGTATPALATTSRIGADGLASTGRPVVQQIQRQLIARYGGRSGFPAVTTDGLWTPQNHRALIHGLQLELGLSEAIANGNFGKTTRATLKERVGELAVGATDTTTWFVHLLQAALVVNTTWDGPFDGTYSPDQARRTIDIQRMFALPETGRSDFGTWSVLFASDGDTSRSGSAADGITTITTERAATLKAAGYTILGRYLTDSQVPDAIKKQMTEEELDTIFGAGLGIFPIFQEGGTDAGYFSYERGVQAARRAHEAATRFRLRPDATIYYAVDFDATEREVEKAIQPYFAGVHDGLSQVGSRFDVGIYGGRQVCTTISAGHLATYSYLAGRSTGWDSNLGKRIPKNWAYNQILNETIGEGAGRIEIDKNVASGRDAALFSRPPVS